MILSTVMPSKHLTAPVAGLLAVALAATATTPATAQEFGVYTKVFNIAGAKDEAPPEVIVRSLTLFRSGKAYDTIHSAGEVTVFEPNRRRFVIINGPRRLATEVGFDEITRALKKAETTTREYVVELKRKGDPKSLAAAAPLLGQLNPDFSERFDPGSSTLLLSGRGFRYRVNCTNAPDTTSIDRVAFDAARRRYLEYTDWTAKLIDVSPEGYAMNLCDRIIRARYRESRTDPTLIEPGRIYEYTINVGVTGNVFLKGHQIRVEISSSNFPRFDRNPNTGHAFGQTAEMRPARQVVHHSRDYPSRIRLPVIPS